MSTTSKPIADEVLQTAARVIKCLGHPLRLRLLEIMERGGEQNVSELQADSGASQTAVSEQLGILRGHGIVESRRDGTYMLYRIIEPKVFRILACVRECEIIDGRIA
jgi:ArsR family transcriptional regulator